MEALIDNIIKRLVVDKGYRGHNAPPDYRFRMFASGQKRAGVRRGSNVRVAQTLGSRLIARACSSASSNKHPYHRPEPLCPAILGDEDSLSAARRSR